MRVLEVKIDEWKNLRNIKIAVPEDATLVCLVGENGSGKSTVLELIAAVAHHFGISSGVDLPRGDPFQSEHSISISAKVSAATLSEFRRAENTFSGIEDWTGVLNFASRLDKSGLYQRIFAEGVAKPGEADNIAGAITNHLRSRQETQYLHLDADRSYPPVQIQPHQIGEIWSQDWGNPEFTKQFSFRSTRTLYEEWNKYFIGIEENVSSKFLRELRKAVQDGRPQPEFEDPFDGYRRSVESVLPHLRFIGVESEGAQRSIVFDSAGLELSFSKLSGGEREIAFLIGQIERFRLRQGLLMVDEPELHLNPDLLRTWIAFLRDTIEDGQVWLATHSLEAVEVAGPDSSFVFEKDRSSRLTTSVSRLSGRPVVGALSAALGAPAFSISSLRFVFVEGDRQSRERERFFDFCGDAETNRFIEGGSCHEVLRRLENVRILAAETSEMLHVGGVLDRDFRTDSEVADIRSKGAYVLRCHEIENFLIHPPVLDLLAKRAGKPEPGLEMIRRASDKFSGLWIAQRADSLSPQLSSTPKQAMSTLSRQDWPSVASGASSLISESAQYFENEIERGIWTESLEASIEDYRNLRESEELWIRSMGKQSAGYVASILEFSSANTLQRHILQVWREEPDLVPKELVDLREYVKGVKSVPSNAM